MHVFRIVSVCFLFVLISLGTVGGCGGGDDGGGEMDAGEVDMGDSGGGSDNPRTCDEFVNAVCDRADECGLNPPGGGCVVEFLFEDLGIECNEFVVKTFPNQCIDDLDNFDCGLLFGDQLPRSCGEQLVIPDIDIPEGPCGEFIEAQCSRVDECGQFTFNECLLGDLFALEELLGVDCNNVSAGPALDQCLIDFDSVGCTDINNGIIPDSCFGVLIPNDPVEDTLSEPPPSTTANVTTPTLIEPIENQIIQQNNPDIGCPFLNNRGFGFEIFFDWSDSESSNGISGYQLFVMGSNATIPLIDTFVTESEFTDLGCNGFVIDSNLMGWEWTVQAVDNKGNLSDVSETQTFQFGPCRLEDGTPCNAPAP